MNRTKSFVERLLGMMFWTVIILILVGFVLHFASSRGYVPGVTSWIGNHVNLPAQAGV